MRDNKTTYAARSMKYIEQKSENDCAVACIAMFLSAYRPEQINALYDCSRSLIDNPQFYHPEHAKRFHSREQGLHTYFETLVLLSFGIPLVETHLFEYGLNSILSVPSAMDTGKGVMHAIVWDAHQQKILDPAPVRKYNIESVERAIMNPVEGKEVRVMVNAEELAVLYNLKKERKLCQENIV